MLSDSDYSTDWTTDESWFDSWQGKRIFFLIFRAPMATLEPAQFPVLWVPGAFSARVKLLQRGAGHSSPSVA
jgi:hypothetical protein